MTTAQRLAAMAVSPGGAILASILSTLAGRIYMASVSA